MLMLIGALAYYLFPFFTLLILVLSWHRGWRRRVRLTLAVVLLALWAPLLFGAYRERHYWDGYDLNPRVAAEDLIGSWRFEHEELELNQDGAFSASDGSHGKWSFQPEALLYTNDQEWAILRKDGELLLLKIHDEDPDNWNRHRSFSRRPSPSSNGR
jgi:4-amino-4-deoxy-L-arabinose transferase-like glycosyltransferase